MKHIFGTQNNNKVSKKEGWIMMIPAIVIFLSDSSILSRYILPEQHLIISLCIVVTSILFWIGMLIVKIVRKNQFNWAIIALIILSVLFELWYICELS